MLEASLRLVATDGQRYAQLRCASRADAMRITENKMVLELAKLVRQLYPHPSSPSPSPSPRCSSWSSSSTSYR